MLARDREYVLSMLSQLEAVFMNNRVSVIRNRTAPCHGQRMHLERTHALPFWVCVSRGEFFINATAGSTRRRPYVAAINHLHDVIYRGRGCCSTWKRI